MKNNRYLVALTLALLTGAGILATCLAAHHRAELIGFEPATLAEFADHAQTVAQAGKTVALAALGTLATFGGMALSMLID